MTTHSNVSAGWYPDPHGAPQLLRYWDGSQWTEHTNPAGGQPQAPAQGQAPAQAQVPQQQAAPQQQYQQQAAAQQSAAAPQQGAPRVRARSSTSRSWW